jgi:putative membrane protein
MNGDRSDVHRRFQIGLLIATWLLLPLSFLGGEYLREQPLHHVPTVIALLLLHLVAARSGLSDAALGAILVFLWLHILGARWIYSFVPYDEWSRSLFDLSISEQFRFRRNHYDRLVHFAYGALAMVPQVEVLRRKLGLRVVPAVAIGIALVLGTSALYEIGEWILAVVMSPENAEAYTGQQGDAWDPQKDMVLALAGALVSAVILLRPGVHASVRKTSAE